MTTLTRPRLTFANLREHLDKFTPEQLAAPIVWSGDERGGYVREVYIHSEDWIGDPSDRETWLPRSHALVEMERESYTEASVCIPAGTVHLIVD